MGIDKIINVQHRSVADPHLQIRGGRVEGGSHPDPEIAAGPGLPKVFAAVRTSL